MYYKLLIYQHLSIDNTIDYLQKNGFVVDIASDDNIIDKLEEKDYDACLLDAAYTDRYSLIAKARNLNRNAAVIFLTKGDLNISEVDDAINAFNAGADDCVIMPYNIKELVCRLNAVLKRAGKSSFGSPHSIGNYLFDPKEHTLTLNGEVTKLPERESKLLLMLSEYRNTIMPRSVALKAIWYDDNVYNGRSMEVHIVRLRKRLAGDPRVSIIGMRSQGFVLSID